MEKKMETTTMGLGFRNGKENGNHYIGLCREVNVGTWYGGIVFGVGE